MPSDANESVTSSQSISLGLFGAAIAVSAWGSSGVIVKALDLDPVAISFYRFTVYSLAIFLVIRLRGNKPTLRVLKHSAAGGISLGIDVVLFFTAVKTTTIVNATTIGALQPIIVLSIATRFFGERVRLREIIAAFVAIAGVVVVITQSSGNPEWNGAGDLAALGALFADRLHRDVQAIGRGADLNRVHTWHRVLDRIGGPPVGFAAGQDMSIPNVNQWAVLLALVIIGGLFGHSLMNWSLTRIPLWIGSTLTLLIPIVSSLIAWIALDEALTAIQLGAIGLVIVALSVIVTSQRNPTPTPPPTAPLTSSTTDSLSGDAKPTSPPNPDNWRFRDMSDQSAAIDYTFTDEAPALATYSLLPVVRAFAGVAGLG